MWSIKRTWDGWYLNAITYNFDRWSIDLCVFESYDKAHEVREFILEKFYLYDYLPSELVLSYRKTSKDYPPPSVLY